MSRTSRARLQDALGQTGPGQAGFVGDHNQLGPVSRAELGHRPVDVGLGGQRAHEQGCGDFVVAHARSDPGEHLPLPVSEYRQHGGVVWLGGTAPGVAATNAQFLTRLRASRRPPVLGHLPDGSVLSLIGGIKVRVITASVTVTCHDGTRYGGTYRLATTLLDHRTYPAAALIALYHERWEHEITYLALRHTLLAGRVLRSHDPEGLRQEMWALLALYQALRIAITDAVATVPGVDPDRASYQIAVETAQTLVTGAQGVTTSTAGRTGDIGRAVLANLHPPRRPRVCARRVKSPLSRWNKHPPGKPRTCQRITQITTKVHPENQPPATHPQNCLTTTSGP